MYFDALNGNPGAEDQFVNIFFFRKRDNYAIGYVQAAKIERKSVTYNNPDCEMSTLQTYMITYSVDVRLDANTFSDPGGYYMVWDRCCRNGTITNIQNPGDAGSLFYLEFPPISKDNKNFIDSSPVFPAIVGDYACVNTPFLFDFGGTDPDGDSLVYTLATPLQGAATKDNPGADAVGMTNYPRLTWIDGISVSNMIPGPQPLTVNSKTGMLSVTPGNTGLYVFAVRVDEYRNGVKIGSLTRDFQLKVLDCPKSYPPQLLFKPKGSSVFYTENKVIDMKLSDPNCFEVMVTDASPNQTIRINGRTINSNTNYFSILPAEFKTTTGKDTLKFQICLEDCFATYDNRPLRIELIAEDESCPLPLTDTLTIYIRRPGGSNNAPTVTTSLPKDYVTVQAGSTVDFTVYGKDADNDQVELSAKGQNFTLASKSMSFPTVTGKTAVQQNFKWAIPCDARAGDTLAVEFQASDLKCIANASSTIKTVYLVVDNSLNSRPDVTISLTTQPVQIQIGINNTISFDVTGTDIDTNAILLSGKGRDFDMEAFGMNFEAKSGKSSITSKFTWEAACKYLVANPEKTYIVDFTVADKNCKSMSDITSVELVLSDSPTTELPEFPNVITPNGDGKNDCFILEEIQSDNCTQQFQRFTVYNRWGKKVYSSNLRSNWCPTDISQGYYYYVIEFSNRNYKGGLTIIK